MDLIYSNYDTFLFINGETTYMRGIYCTEAYNMLELNHIFNGDEYCTIEIDRKGKEFLLYRNGNIVEYRPLQEKEYFPYCIDDLSWMNRELERILTLCPVIETLSIKSLRKFAIKNDIVFPFLKFVQSNYHYL